MGDVLTVFAYGDCGSTLTVPLSRVALPAHSGQKYGHGLLPPLLEPGTYAVSPDDFGPPWQGWDEVGADEAAARGWSAPVYARSDGPPAAVLVAPGDVRGAVLRPDLSAGGCCGMDGGDGLNLACARCDRPVATRVDDCGLWPAVWFDAGAVHVVVGAETPVTGWDLLLDERPGLPPIEAPGRWNPVWEAALGQALAHLLAASGGSSVSLPDDPVAAAFRRPVDALLPPGASPKTLVLAGPGRSAAAGDIALVPRHPQTGEIWPAGTASVPLAWDVWAYLAFHRAQLKVADETDPDRTLTPYGPLRPDGRVFRDALARLPVAGRPWLREVDERVRLDPF